jgi:hypothetical protein
MRTVFLVLGLVTAATVLLISYSTRHLPAEIKGTVAKTSSYHWTEAAPPGSGTHQHEWKPGTYPSAVVPLVGHGGNLWMIGQKRSWSSSNGIQWKAFDKHDWGERISMGAVYFDNAFWVTGGMEYATNTFLNEIWSSSDGRQWTLKVEHAEWSPRKGHTLVSFRNKLWLFGGETGVDEHRAPDDYVNDVWSSTDGLQWTKVMDNAPWAVRGNPKVIVFQDRLWLIGGQGQSDIWNSDDGENWTKIQDHSTWGDRYDYGLIVYDDHLWILGGRESNPRNAFNDVWYSSDGKNWVQQTEHAPWTRRSGGFSVAFKDKLFLYGGKHTGHKDGFSGDIWTMSK